VIKGHFIKTVAVLIILFSCLSGIFIADNDDIVWNGYDIRILNTYDINFVAQDINIEIVEDKLFFDGEYILKNVKDNTVEAIIGLPSNSLDNIEISEKNNALKHYNRTVKYIEDRYPSDALPEVSRWYTVNLWFKAGEIKVINVKYEAEIKNNSKGIFSVRYHKNNDLMQSDASKIVMSLKNFHPYNVLNTTGALEDKALLSGDNTFTLEMNRTSYIFGIDYELIDKLAIDRFDFSSDKKLKNIAAAFRKKDYNSVFILCDEYVKNPTDPAFNMAQINYIKAETYRKQADFEKYIEEIKKLDYNMLYPNRLKYKILYDLDKIIENETQDKKLLEMMKKLHEQAIDQNEFIGRWMENSGRNYALIEEANIQEVSDEKEEESIFTRIVDYLKINSIVEKIIDFKYLELVLIIVSFALGYLLGRRKKKRRDHISYYKF